MRQILRIRTFLVVLWGLLGVAWSQPAWAIPAFARIYGKSCTACHTVFPQLNPEGEAFRNRGLHGPTPAIEPIKVGPLELPGTLPFAILFGVGEDLSKVDTPGKKNPTHTHLNFQILKLLAGGELGPHLSFRASLAPIVTDTRSGEISVNTRMGQAFGLAHAELDGWLTNLKIGLFELPLGASASINRLSVQPYTIYGVSAFTLLSQSSARPSTGYGAGGYSSPYKPFLPRGARKDTLLLGATQIGAELSGLHQKSGFSLALGVTNGSNNRWDNNASKDFYIRMKKTFGLHQTGLFLYYSPDILGPGRTNQLLRLGPDFRLYFRRFQVFGQFLTGYDSNPTGYGNDLWHYGGFLEGNYRWTPSLVSLLRFDYVRTQRFDDTLHGGHTRVQRQLWNVTAGTQWLLLPNLKLVTETSYGENHEAISDRTVKSWFFTIRFVTSFWPLTPPAFTEWLGWRRGW